METFKTARLLMRQLQLDDEAFYCACYADPVLMRHIGEPLGRDAALRSFKAALKAGTEIPVRRYTWVMQDTQSHCAIGLLGLVCDQAKPEPVKAQIGAVIFKQFQSKGFAAEAIAALVDIAFSQSDLAALYTQHTMHHGAAKGLMRKLGFHHETKASGEAFSSYWVLHRADWRMERQGPATSR